jgi:ABC-type uncharacterized transport system involved in gliding motility auxiliary subunit
MKTHYRRFAPLGLYLSLAAILASAGLYIVYREFNLPLQISLSLAVLGVAIFAFLDPAKMRAALTGRQARYGSNALIMTLAFAGILVVLNYLVYQNSQRWDLTENQQFTLAPETIQTLERLPQPVTALAFYTPRMSSTYAQGLLDQYKFSSKGQFEYRFINPEEDPLAATQANITRDGTIVLTMGGSQEQVTLITERELTSSLVRLISPDEKALYFLTGHGEYSPDGPGEQTYSQVKAALERKNYRVETLNLLAMNAIPDDAVAIVIAGPTKPVSEGEVTMLAEYLDNGGGLIVLAEPLPLTDFGEDPDPLAEYLEESWGIVLGEDMVVDLTSTQPFVAVANQYGEHLITARMQGLITFFPTARSVTRSGGTGGASMDELVFTAPQSWAERDLAALVTSAEAGEQPQLAPDEGVDLIGPVPLAMAAEDFTSRARLVAFGDAEFPSDAFFSQYGNGDLLINAIDWVGEQEDLLNLTPKDSVSRILVPPQRYTLNLIMLGSIFVLPGSVLLAGVVVWIQRRRRG